MVDILSAWKYTDHVNSARRSSLAAPGSFDETVRLVHDDLREIRVRGKGGWDKGVEDCVQPIFCFELPNIGDALFNGPWGYRAQYWMSAAQGLAANATLLAMLAPKLLNGMDIHPVPELAKIDMHASLLAASAKIWMQEDLAMLRDPPADLAVDRWVQAARNGVELARSGLASPVVTTFEVKGALIDPYGNEVMPLGKVCRHQDIHQYGYS